MIGWGFTALPVLWLHHPRLLQFACGIPRCWTNHSHLLQQQQSGQPLQQQQHTHNFQQQQRSHLQWARNSISDFCHQHSCNQYEGEGELRPFLPKLQRLWQKGIRSAKVCQIFQKLLNFKLRLVQNKSDSNLTVWLLQACQSDGRGGKDEALLSQLLPCTGRVTIQSSNQQPMNPQSLLLKTWIDWSMISRLWKSHKQNLQIQATSYYIVLRHNLLSLYFCFVTAHL